MYLDTKDRGAQPIRVRQSGYRVKDNSVAWAAWRPLGGGNWKQCCVVVHDIEGCWAWKSRDKSERLKNSNIRIAAVRSDPNEASLVPVTGCNNNESLKDAQNLEKLRQGQVYM